MIEQAILKFAREGILYVMLISGIPIVLSMIVGICVSIFQAATQIQEQTLTFVPKIVIVFGTLIILGPWMLKILVRFATILMESFPRLAGPV